MKVEKDDTNTSFIFYFRKEPKNRSITDPKRQRWLSIAFGSVFVNFGKTELNQLEMEIETGSIRLEPNFG